MPTLAPLTVLARVAAVALLGTIAACGSGSGRPASLEPAATASSHDGPHNPSERERSAGRVLATRSAHGITIAPPPEDVAPTVTRETAWATLKNSTGASENADMSWVLLAEYSADHPAKDPEMDGIDVKPVYQRRLAWVLFQFGVPSLGGPGPGGPFCDPTRCTPKPRQGPKYMDVIAGVEAETGESIGGMVVGYPSAPGTNNPTAAPCRPERLELNQSRVRAGDTVRVSSKPAGCALYPEGKTYRAVLLFVGRADPVVLGDVPVAPDGSFTMELEIPRSASSGEAAIKMEGSAMEAAPCDGDGAHRSCALYLASFEILAPG